MSHLSNLFPPRQPGKFTPSPSNDFTPTPPGSYTPNEEEIELPAKGSYTPLKNGFIPIEEVLLEEELLSYI